MRAFLVAGLWVTVGASASMLRAQSTQGGTLGGTVARDTVGGVIANAEVSIPDLNRATLTSSRGGFELSNVPPGRYAIAIRAIGYQLLVDTIDVAAGQRIDADIVLTATPVDLAPLKTTEKAPAKRLPIGLQEMEDRRKMHMGGYFVTDSMLRANDEKKLSYFLSRIPAARLLPTPSGELWLLNSRSDPRDPRKLCYMDIYIDGAVYFRGPPSASNPVPDFNALWANGFSGIELYPSGASAPAEYNGTRGMDCGTVLLWTRRTP